MSSPSGKPTILLTCHSATLSQSTRSIALRNGALVGLVVGSGLFVADVLVSRADGLYLTGAGYVVFGAIYGGLGLAAGAGLDALIGGDRRIYIRGTTARISVAPTLRPDRAGALIGISW